MRYMVIAVVSFAWANGLFTDNFFIWSKKRKKLFPSFCFFYLVKKTAARFQTPNFLTESAYRKKKKGGSRLQGWI
jgi:hypothetical protein